MKVVGWRIKVFRYDGAWAWACREKHWYTKNPEVSTEKPCSKTSEQRNRGSSIPLLVKALDQARVHRYQCHRSGHDDSWWQWERDDEGFWYEEKR